MINNNNYCQKNFFNNKYWKNIIAYQNGMIGYVRDNEIMIPRYLIIYNLILSLCQEFREFIIELFQFKLKDSLMELFDIWHTIIIFIFMILSPKKFWISRNMWSIIYILSFGISPIKHGNRYIRHKCIRNINHCLKGDHKCIITKKHVV